MSGFDSKKAAVDKGKSPSVSRSSFRPSGRLVEY